MNALPAPTMTFRQFIRVFVVSSYVLLAGCDLLVLHPYGAVAKQQSHLIVVSTVLMLLIVVPVLALTLLFAWRYRASNPKATYAPDWDHSTSLELLIWSAPLLIVIALGAITWINTHTLDPYRRLAVSTRSPAQSLDRPAGAPAETAVAAPAADLAVPADHPAAALNAPPLVIEVVALDWKWLFIYPAEGIATVNELAAPVGVPLRFKITSSSVMNSFFIPALAGQIYAMPGMQTELNAIIDQVGAYEGFSANYSGAGFSGMRFTFHGMTLPDFENWVGRNRESETDLNASKYLQLARPSERDPVRRYSTVAGGLYEAILHQCLQAEHSC